MCCYVDGLTLELVGTLEESDSLKFLLHLSLFLIGHVAEWSTVWTQIEAHQFHDALAAHDITTVVTDNVDDLLSKVLLLACCLDITVLPSLNDTHQFLTVIVGCSANQL